MLPSGVRSRNRGIRGPRGSTLGCMGIGFFVYTTAMIAVCVVACSTSLTIWLMTRRRDAIIAAAGFALYALETSLIFYDEYSNAKYDYTVTFDLPLTHPGLRWFFGTAIIACIWLFVLVRVHESPTPRRAAALVLPFAVLSLVLLPRSGAASRLQQYLFWLARDLAVVACLVFAAWRYRHRASKVEKLDIERSRRFFLIACVLMACVIAEDTFMIMVVNPDEAWSASVLFWYLSERNISENILMVACAVQLVVRYAQTLRVYAHHPSMEGADEGVRAADESNLENKLVLFGDAHGLTKRELEVVSLVVRGLDVQNIASELVLAPGTVKAHLHRIYKKAGVGSREALVEEFWRQ